MGPTHASRNLPKHHHEEVGQHKRAVAQHRTTTEPVFSWPLLGMLQYHLSQNAGKGATTGISCDGHLSAACQQNLTVAGPSAAQ